MPWFSGRSGHQRPMTRFLNARPSKSTILRGVCIDYILLQMRIIEESRDRRRPPLRRPRLPPLVQLGQRALAVHSRHVPL